MTLSEQIDIIGARARAAARTLSTLSAEQKNTALIGMADELDRRIPGLLAANALDIEGAESHGLNAAAVDRLRLTPERIAKMSLGIREVAALHDPVGEVIRAWSRPNGIHITKIRTPIGVIGMIYESRPNVTADAAVLCIKTGNAVILRGGSEAFHSNTAIADALRAGGVSQGLPEDAVQLIPTRDRDAVRLLAEADRYVDVIIPRGGHALIEAVVSHARMPVIKHYHGVCHVYVDSDADLEMATRIAVNAKCQRPGVCNAMETLLIHESVASAFLAVAAPQFQAAGVELRADPASFKILSSMGYTALIPAEEADWTTEYLDLILSVRMVDDIDDAMNHIARHGSQHSDAIVTRDAASAERFLNEVDSATIFWNASTRFNDGGEFGFGAEIGISTDKLHARGPMGLEELTTYKYQIRGDGQIRT